jgi:hypothetical protein
MRFFPYNYYEFESNLTPEQITDKLSKNVSVVTKFSNWSLLQNDDNYFFQGIISKNYFKICRKIDKRRDSFRAIISGKIETKKNKTNIKISVRLNWAVYVFILIYTCPLLLICILLPFKLPYDEFELKPQNFMILIPYVMLIFGFLLFNLPFQEDSKKTIDFIKNTIR